MSALNDIIKYVRTRLEATMAQHSNPATHNARAHACIIGILITPSQAAYQGYLELTAYISQQLQRALGPALSMHT